MEINCIAKGLNQSEAHKTAEKVYNYAIESRDYYRSLQLKDGKQTMRSIENVNNHISGAITFNTEERY